MDSTIEDLPIVKDPIFLRIGDFIFRKDKIAAIAYKDRGVVIWVDGVKESFEIAVAGRSNARPQFDTLCEAMGLPVIG